MWAAGPGIAGSSDLRPEHAHSPRAKTHAASEIDAPARIESERRHPGSRRLGRGEQAIELVVDQLADALDRDVGRRVLRQLRGVVRRSGPGAGRRW